MSLGKNNDCFVFFYVHNIVLYIYQVSLYCYCGWLYLFFAFFQPCLYVFVVISNVLVSAGRFFSFFPCGVVGFPLVLKALPFCVFFIFLCVLMHCCWCCCCCRCPPEKERKEKREKKKRQWKLHIYHYLFCSSFHFQYTQRALPPPFISPLNQMEGPTRH